MSFSISTGLEASTTHFIHCHHCGPLKFLKSVEKTNSYCVKYIIDRYEFKVDLVNSKRNFSKLGMDDPTFCIEKQKVNIALEKLHANICFVMVYFPSSTTAFSRELSDLETS